MAAVTLVLIGIGVFFIVAGALNLNWFLEMQARRSFSFEKMFGRNGARIAFVVLGVIFIVLGVVRR
ncbi:MAG: immunity 17 family protein [Anaerolineae bacterium]|nr:immunity 17 family protein [Anaerolineae bacterium]